MSNRSPKRSLLTERKVRSVIREEINTRYGNRLTARQKVMLEEGILQGVKNALGGIFGADGVGSAAGKYIKGKIEGIGANIAKAADGVKTAYAAGQLEPARKAFKQLQADTNKAGTQLAAMYLRASKLVPPDLEAFNTPATKKEADTIPAEPAAAPAAPAAAAAAAPAAAAAAPAAAPAAALEESLRRKRRF